MIDLGSDLTALPGGDLVALGLADLARTSSAAPPRSPTAAQALAKLERGFTQDEADVSAMVGLGLLEPSGLLEPFDAIEDQVYRFPSIDASGLRGRVESVARHG